MDSVNYKVDSMDRKMTSVDQDVLVGTQGWRYLGRGYMRGKDEESWQGVKTLGQCLQICEDKHRADHQWNGFIWTPSNGLCWCEKNDKGHDPTQLTVFMHFMKQ